MSSNKQNLSHSVSNRASSRSKGLDENSLLDENVNELDGFEPSVDNIREGIIWSEILNRKY